MWLLPAGNIKAWVKKNGNFIFPFLAFTTPLIVRSIPEFLMREYLVGFDTIGFYVPSTIEWAKTGVDFLFFMADAPLLYLFTIGVVSAGGSIVLFIKILSPLLLGLLGLTIYFYANRVLSWSSKKSLLVVLFSTLYFVALRISWDMLRSELGLIFLFLSLILLQKSGRSIKATALLSLTLGLVVLSHQLITVIMFVILVATLFSSYRNKRMVEVKRILLGSIPAGLLFLLILYVNYFVYSLPAIGFSMRYSAGFNALIGASHFDFVINTLGFLAFCYLPLLPFIFFGARGFKSNIQLKAWIFWLFIPLILVVISPEPFLVGGVLPYRWILFLMIPLAFYAAQGFASIRWAWIKVVVSIFLVLLSVSFIVLPNESACTYFSYYPSYVPKSMLQNTLQLSDCEDAFNALNWARSNLPQNASLLTHQAFYGWATLLFDFDSLVYYGFDDPAVIAQELSYSSSSTLYLVWWVNGSGWYGQESVSYLFQDVYHSGNIAIYKFMIS